MIPLISSVSIRQSHTHIHRHIVTHPLSGQCDPWPGHKGIYPFHLRGLQCWGWKILHSANTHPHTALGTQVVHGPCVLCPTWHSCKHCLSITRSTASRATTLSDRISVRCAHTHPHTLVLTQSANLVSDTFLFPVLHLVLFSHTMVLAPGQIDISAWHLSALPLTNSLSRGKACALTHARADSPRRCIWAGRHRCRRCRAVSRCSSAGNGCSWSTRSVREGGRRQSEIHSVSFLNKKKTKKPPSTYNNLDLLLKCMWNHFNSRHQNRKNSISFFCHVPYYSRCYTRVLLRTSLNFWGDDYLSDR